ncbi:hypothetical protein J3Q64DRAFT_1062908 [Phycomyces blakesleeanus]|uniref:peptidylprolyl isomerase n=1 Tax=Phycomyces blakesleeanus TaxID=4837 RepID=A0ABR3BF67_PHYBL
MLHSRKAITQKEKKIFEEKANEQLVMIYNNMSNVYSKQNKWERVIEYATMVTALDPKNKKATFRLGQAYLRQGKADKAKPLLEDVLKMDPNDALVKSEIARLEEDEQHMENREKNIYRKMFS